MGDWLSYVGFRTEDIATIGNTAFLCNSFGLRLEAPMYTKVPTFTSWSTASLGDADKSCALDLCALGAHLRVCQGPHAALFSLHSVASSMHGFVASRFVTTLLVVALLVGFVSLAL
jgi:hypothetical protein